MSDRPFLFGALLGTGLSLGVLLAVIAIVGVVWP